MRATQGLPPPTTTPRPMRRSPQRRGATPVGVVGPLPDSALKQAAIAIIKNAYPATVGPEPYDAATQAGIDAGTAAAKAILALREDDGSATPHLPYTLDPAPGVYQPRRTRNSRP